MDELNPDHPVTKAAHNSWHTIAAVLVHMSGKEEIVITGADVAKLPHGSTILLHDKPDGMHLRIIDRATAEMMVANPSGTVH